MSEPQKYVTLKDLADFCGVTPTTVSLALRNHPRISESTKEKVHEAALRLGYRRHPMVSALMTTLHRSRMTAEAVPLAAVYAHEEKHVGSHPFHRVILEGMTSRADELGFRLDSFFLGEKGMTAKRVSEILSARGIRGIIVPPLPIAAGHLSIDWNLFSAIAIGYSMHRPQLHRVCPDQYAAILLALKQVIRSGYSRPGLLLNARSDVRTRRLWSSGFYGHEFRRGVHEMIPALECDEIRESNLMLWFNRHRPDVIISSDLKVLRALHQAGLNVPGDVGLVSLAGPDKEMKIAGTNQNPHMLGAVAVERLSQLIYYNEIGSPETPQVILIPPIWCPGTSIEARRGTGLAEEEPG
ncbi:LacI family DNA-binding transcriptional regulator [Luteolibacter ambystomatis]|uniref:LacI family DNA-binding transcriptional regulator n=1 Tax=Luteolibacter ambystomatis TaxID=2824561 RepID=A0A975PG12_9BACT|nr:LacI family DNA-binding transcriptional regulator [Luteolibacter ambystomatis]QUE51927.1 LacI family DNA-binding transcriptional regulator [Luteolibacter ambystomatis]